MELSKNVILESQVGSVGLTPDLKNLTTGVTAINFIKAGSTDNDVLLGGGGTKPLSEISNYKSYNCIAVCETTPKLRLKNPEFTSIQRLGTGIYRINHTIGSDSVAVQLTTQSTNHLRMGNPMLVTATQGFIQFVVLDHLNNPIDAWFEIHVNVTII